MLFCDDFICPSMSLLSIHWCIIHAEPGPGCCALSCIGERNGNPLQCSCLENPWDGGAWWAAVYGVAQSRTRLKWLSSSSSRLVMSIPVHVLIAIFMSSAVKHPFVFAYFQLDFLVLTGEFTEFFIYSRYGSFIRDAICKYFPQISTLSFHFSH